MDVEEFDVPREGAGFNTAEEDDKPNPYCDKLEIPYSVGCHDRKDYYDGGPNDGLYPCNDGSNKEDWRDCKDVSGYDYDNNDNENSGDDEDTGGSDPNDEEEDQNCGGESCTDDEKEDSTSIGDGESGYIGDDYYDEEGNNLSEGQEDETDEGVDEEE